MRFPPILSRQICPRLRFVHSISTAAPSHDRWKFSKSLNEIDIKKFQDDAFSQKLPNLFQRKGKHPSCESTVPAENLWFKRDKRGHNRANLKYLREFDTSQVNYEATVDDSYRPWIEVLDTSKDPTIHKFEEAVRGAECSDSKTKATFHRFASPLKLLLDYSSQPAGGSGSSLKSLYIAQMQLNDLPPELKADLPTPRLVLEAGRGDIYDSNLWMGPHPTYTPLHKDPNPNLFLQMSGTKLVKLFEPGIGAGILREARMRATSGDVNSNIRGEEMMEGPEKAALDELVWDEERTDGLLVEVRAGDALFIPMGWWHSIKSVDTGDFVASVNWWFR